jgi:hypothetical protein
MKSFSQDSVMFVVDFAENYSFEVQNEVQSMYWHSYQISILVHICLYHNLDASPYDEDTWILTKYHSYITDNKVHDSDMIQHCFKLHWQYMVNVKSHFV